MSTLDERGGGGGGSTWGGGGSCAAIHPHLNVVAFDGDVLGDRGEDFLAQKGEQIGLAARGPLVGQQDLQPLPRDRAPCPGGGTD